MRSTGPISKFQSPGVIILIRLSISTLNFASGAPGVQKSDQIWTNFGSNDDDFFEVSRIEPGSSRKHPGIIWKSFEGPRKSLGEKMKQT